MKHFVNRNSSQSIHCTGDRNASFLLEKRKQITHSFIIYQNIRITPAGGMFVPLISDYRAMLRCIMCLCVCGIYALCVCPFFFLFSHEHMFHRTKSIGKCSCHAEMACHHVPVLDFRVRYTLMLFISMLKHERFLFTWYVCVSYSRM